MVLRERHVGEHILTRRVHHVGHLREFLAPGIGDLLPLLVRCFGCLLCEDGLDHGNQQVALLARGEHLASGSAKAFLIVGNDQLHAAQPAVSQRTQEGLPKWFGLRGAGHRYSR